MTRIPVRFSRMTRVRRSIFFCMDLKMGVPNLRTSRMMIRIAGMVNSSTSVISALLLRDMTRPPTNMTGAMTRMRSSMTSTF